MSSEGFSALEKERRDMSSEGCAAHPVGYNRPLQIGMVVWPFFFEFEDYNVCLAHFKFLKKCAKRPLLSAAD
jgi:hypothetical protein